MQLLKIAFCSIPELHFILAPWDHGNMWSQKNDSSQTSRGSRPSSGRNDTNGVPQQYNAWDRAARPGSGMHVDEDFKNSSRETRETVIPTQPRYPYPTHHHTRSRKHCLLFPSFAWFLDFNHSLVPLLFSLCIRWIFFIINYWSEASENWPSYRSKISHLS